MGFLSDAELVELFLEGLAIDGERCRRHGDASRQCMYMVMMCKVALVSVEQLKYLLIR